MSKYYRHVESGDVYPEFHSPAGYQAANPQLWEPCDAKGNLLNAPAAEVVTDVPPVEEPAPAIPKRTKVKADADSGSN
jgi:hypothetical protein